MVKCLLSTQADNASAAMQSAAEAFAGLEHPTFVLEHST